MQYANCALPDATFMVKTEMPAISVRFPQFYSRVFTP